MAKLRKRPIKKGLSRLTHYDNPEVERLRREVDEEIRRLRVAQSDNDEVECCDDAFLIDGSRIMEAPINMGGEPIENVGDVDGVDVSAHAASTTAHGISAFGATLVDDTSASAARATLALAAVAASGSASDLTTGTVPAARMPAFTGDVTTVAGFVATTIAPAAVTLAKMANLAADTVIGRTSGTGVPEAITVTAAGRALLDDAAASNQRTTLGLVAIAASGSAADLSSGIIPDARMPDLTGDVTTTEGAVATTIANAAVTLAKMADLAADTVIGRTSVGTGVPQAITVTAAGRALIDDAAASNQRTTLGLTSVATATDVTDIPMATDDRLLGQSEASGFVDEITVGAGLTLSGGNLSVTTVPDTVSSTGVVLVDINCAAQASSDWNAGGDGTYTLGGFTWTISGTAVADTFGPDGSTGIRYNASTSTSQWVTGTRTAAALRIAITTLIPTWDSAGTYIIEAYYSSLTLGTSGDRVQMALDYDTAGTDRLFGAGRRNNAGTQETCSILDAGTIAGNAYTDNAIALRVCMNGGGGLSGTYSSGFPVRYTHSGGYSQAPASFASAMDGSANLVFAFINGGTGGACDATLTRIRVRRIG